MRSSVAPACAAVGMLLLTSCAGGGSSASGTDGATTVTAAFYPFAFVSERVAGRHATVTNLTEAGADPHSVELTLAQVAEVSSADIVVYRQGLQPAVDDAVEENAEGTVLEVTDVVGAEAPGGDPHLWQDPTKLATVTEAVATALAEADPRHAEAYRANAAQLGEDLADLDRDFRAGLADCERRTLVTSHAAFGHLADRYDLRMIPISGASPESEPTPARLAELRQVVAEENVTTVFTETLASPRLARTLAEEAGVRTAVLDPVEGLTEATADEDYLSLMRANLAQLRRANGCT